MPNLCQIDTASEELRQNEEDAMGREQKRKQKRRNKEKAEDTLETP